MGRYCRQGMVIVACLQCCHMLVLQSLTLPVPRCVSVHRSSLCRVLTLTSHSYVHPMPRQTFLLHRQDASGHSMSISQYSGVVAGFHPKMQNYMGWKLKALYSEFAFIFTQTVSLWLSGLHLSSKEGIIKAYVKDLQCTVRICSTQYLYFFSTKCCF